MRKAPAFALTLLATVATSSSAQAEMAPFTRAEIKWDEAVASFKSTIGSPLDTLRVLKGYDDAVKKMGPQGYLDEPFGKDLQTINAVTSTIRPNVYTAGSPVLLPLDVERLVKGMRDSKTFLNKEKTSAYFGMLTPLAFYPGPYGYRAYFQLKKTSTVMISGSSLLYQLSSKEPLPTLQTCTELVKAARSAGGGDAAANKKFYDYLETYETKIGLVAAEYFGEIEATVPCLFADALIEVHILCDSIGDPDCKVKDLARAIMGMLAFVGGAPRPKSNPAVNDPINLLSVLIGKLETGSAKKAAKVQLPTYRDPGDLLANSGVNGSTGSRDFGVYGPILFPTDPSATAQTVVYRQGEECLKGDQDKGSTCIHNGKTVTKAPVGEWRDNFCEARSGNRLFACPAGRGHAGQDIWGKGWKAGVYELRTVTDGIAFRRFPAQPAVTISDVYGSNIDYVYRHMRPSILAKNGIAASKPTPVARGCVLALVDRLQGVAESGVKTALKDGATFYVATASHLHFEIRVPTLSGYQNVSPYWTTTQAHKVTLTNVDTAPVATGSCATKP